VIGYLKAGGGCLFLPLLLVLVVVFAGASFRCFLICWLASFSIQPAAECGQSKPAVKAGSCFYCALFCGTRNWKQGCSCSCSCSCSSSSAKSCSS
jgi:hypothetical protein